MGEAPLKDILKNVIKELKGSNKGGKIVSLWKDTVGAEVAEHTRPVSFAKGRLVVNVSDSSRLYELTLRRAKIIETLNKTVKRGKIKEVRFKIGEV